MEPDYSSDLHRRLRQEMRTAHDRVEAVVDSQGFFASLEGYREYLGRMFAFHAEAERRLNELDAHEVVPDWSDRQRARSALEDLLALEGAPREYSGAGSAGYDSLGSDHRPAQVLGILYVLEGSTLGGAALLGAAQRLGIPAGRGNTFIASYGPERGRMWRRFLDTLAEWERRGVSQSHVVRAAELTFDRAAGHLKREPPK